METKGIIFDLDGTLIDSFPAIHEAFLQTLMEMNLPTEQLETLSQMYGNTITEMIMSVIPETYLQKNTIDEFVQIAMKKYRPALWKEKIHIFSGVKILLEKLKRKNLLLGIVTNSPQEIVDNITKLFFPQTFDKIWGDQGDGRAKPDPYGINQTIASWGCSKDQVLYVGDTVVDLQTAKTAGCRMALANWNRTSMNMVKVEESLNISIIKKPLDLINLIS